MKRYYVYETNDGSGLDCWEDDSGQWCKADEAIAGMESLAAELAVAQLRIAELEAANTQLQFELDKLAQDYESLSRLYAEREPTEAPF